MRFGYRTDEIESTPYLLDIDTVQISFENTFPRIFVIRYRRGRAGLDKKLKIFE
jgi:hypothetical protein